MHLVRMHKLKNAQSTCPVVNHAQDLYQLVIGTSDVSRASNTLLPIDINPEHDLPQDKLTVLF